MTNANDPKPSPIHYERTQGAFPRKLLAVLLLLTVSNTAILAMEFLLPRLGQVRDYLRSRRASMTATAVPAPATPAVLQPAPLDHAAALLADQERWMNFSRPANCLLYEEDHAAIPALLKQGYLSDDLLLTNAPMQVLSPAYLPCEGSSELTATGDVLLFAHRMVSRGGNVRLVSVGMSPSGSWELRGNGFGVKISRHFYTEVVFPGAGALPPTRRSDRGVSLKAEDFVTVADATKLDGAIYNQVGLMRLYAGQIDPHDPAHFTIAFAWGERRGILSGTLDDDERIELSGLPLN